MAPVKARPAADSHDRSQMTEVLRVYKKQTPLAGFLSHASQLDEASHARRHAGADSTPWLTVFVTPEAPQPQYCPRKESNT